MNELADRLGEAGYAVEVERLRGRASAEPWLASYSGVCALAALLVYPAPFVATLLGIVAVVLHARESDGRPLLRAGAREGANVVARAPAATLPDVIVVADVGAPHRRIDDGAQRAFRLCLQTLMTAVPAAGAVAWVAEAETELPRSMGTGGVVAAAAIVALVLVAHRPPADEAGRVNPALEVLVALAPLLREQNVWLVGAGAGPDSIRALVDSHANAVAGAAWLNLAPSSSGDVVAVSEEGTWRERRADRWLLDAAEEAGAEVRTHRAATRVTPLLAGRRRALTLLVGGGPADVRTVAGTVLPLRPLHGDGAAPGRRTNQVTHPPPAD